MRTAEVRHKGGSTIGTRVELSGRSLVAMPDHDLAVWDPAAERRARTCCCTTRSTSRTRPPDHGLFGHSPIEWAVRFARVAEVGHLVLTHHAPTRTDDELDAIAGEFSAPVLGLRVSVPREDKTVAV